MAARYRGAGGGAYAMPSKPSANAMHPTVAFLMLLVILEYGAYIGLRYYFRSAHGG